MSIQSDRKSAIKKLRTLVLTPKADVEDFREKLEDSFCTIFMPNHVERDERSFDCVPGSTSAAGPVRCDILVPELYASDRLMIYIHGGSFAGGSRDSYRNFCSSLANACSCRVVVPEFSLAPTHPFPTAIDEITTVLKQIHADFSAAGNDGVQIIIAADGSGASIALGMLLKLPSLYRKAVSNIILFSPWLDVTSECPQIKGRHVHDEVLSGDDMHRAIDMYTYASNFKNPLVSPLKAAPEDFAGFPPFYIQLGGKEMLFDQTQQMREILVSAGVDVTVDVWPDMMFMFQMADEFLAESHHAIEKLGKFLCRRQEDINEEEIKERDEILRKNNIVVE